MNHYHRNPLHQDFPYQKGAPSFLIAHGVFMHFPVLSQPHLMNIGFSISIMFIYLLFVILQYCGADSVSGAELSFDSLTSLRCLSKGL
ncbi:unnamed protein product [Arabis nemorensis]|uniref:Uncharacterized protein n=1 Tax=Arabis nemorensis TaxID=586526 RepID=A0A565CMC5_9BRAS|nr:unnamed protein product [Arabis nemorensis]